MGQIISMLNAMRGHKVYVDTNVFIYFLERNVEFFAAAEPVIQAITCGDLHGYTGEITIAETLVGPYRTGDPLLIANAQGFFSDGGSALTILRHDKGIFDYAAGLRARHRMKIIDAVHLATALKAACRYFVTNDKAMRSTGALSVVQLSSLL
jgi:predicted nucleic acid-binding protein